ncbi:nicotinate (nicotinamide) nucleotide adenylyltransferase [Foetidibacter luteolus]|uniref:nicotinate (nicotinamide) nucleotide adenylyltransferase n=1 Tax=Foetidibacter luteolus TaxID=2608880 RepID=UPI00129AA5BC|nr:nicotinate (nicotinamide) nucleotide adenylyltransferase [Foetidibacter luteolus]
MKIGLYFGSFNPVHIGHLIIANHIASNCDIQQVWFVVSPQNPFKHSSSLLNEYQRLHLVNLAIGDNTQLKASDIEFRLPKPSYTIDTLAHLKEKYPSHQFSIVMGSDSFQNLDKWKNADALKREYDFIIYQRPSFKIIIDPSVRASVVDAPLLEISATKIRELIKQKKSIQYLVPDMVRKEIESNNYYR